MLFALGLRIDFLVLGVGDLFLDDGAGFARLGGFLDDGAGHFLILGILALVAGVDFALAGLGVLLLGLAARALVLLPPPEGFVDAALQVLHV